MAITASLLLTAIATVAAIIGVAFAILAIATYWQADKKVDDRFQLKYEEHQKKLDEQSAQWASGIRYWTQATMNNDPSQASDLMELALGAWPTAPGARSEMSIRWYNALKLDYCSLLLPRSLRSWFASHQEHDLQNNLVKALKWLVLAIDHESDMYEPALHYVGALIYAMMQNAPQMFLHLKAWIASTQETRPDDTAVMILLSAIHTPQDLVALQMALKTKFPEPLLADVPSTLRIYQQSTSVETLQVWLVIPKIAGSSERVVGIAKNGAQGWTVVNDFVANPRPHTDCPTTEDLMTFLDQRWILLRPVPRPV